MRICDYGCGREAKHQFKNGKWCCSKNIASCPFIKEKMKSKRKGFQGKHTIETRKRISESVKKALKKSHIFNSNKFKQNRSKVNKGKNNPMFGRKHPNRLTISKIKKRYSFFSQIEKMRYNPDKLKEIQVHCKNHNCPNSKEKGGWFTPTRIQLSERIRQLEDKDGNGGSYFYCSQECKNICPLFNLKSDPFKEIKNLYSHEEHQQFTEFVLERDNYECQYCDEPSTIVHHERPQKLEPFFSLDPDFAWSCCEKCHYKYGHKTGTECSTGYLSNKICLGER